MIRKVLIFCLLILFAISAKAQLSDLHYLPPLKQGQNNAGIREQAVYLSTPEPTPFLVNIYRGTDPTPIDSYTISNVNPEVFPMSNGDNNIILVNNANTGVVLNNSGLRFEAPSGNKFYVNYRGSSSAQSASLTSKGRQAMGTSFKWGGVPNLGRHPSKSNTLGIMATEDNTTINLFGYDPGCEFRVGNNRAGITANTHQITLNANESFVYETYIGDTPTQAHEDGWIGASIVSDKDIVISNGSINYGRQVGATNRDAGIDQPVPENRLGKEYVFVRGNGGSNGFTEFPLLIGTSDNTQIFVNGSATPIATINNGDYFEVPSNLYSGNTAGHNMFIETSKDVYAYQCTAGATTNYTQGLNFVAPVNCLLPDVMDNIPDIKNMAGTSVTGGLTIIAAVNTPDANISVIDGSGPVTLPGSRPVAGSSDWKTFYIPNLTGNVSVQSTGPMAVGFFGYNNARGVAGYFSGFDTLPEVTLEIRGGSGCFVGSEIFEATSSNFDAFQWYKDGVLIPGANSPIYTPSGAGEYFLRGTKGPCTYDSNAILGLYCDPDVHIEKTVDNAEIMEGETATFTIRVQNWGVGPLTNLQITDNIPSGLTFVSDFTITGSWSGNTWNIGTLNGGEVAELELEVRADEIDTLPLLSLTNTATHTQDQTDTNLTEDSPSARIVVHNDFDNDGVNDITDLDDDNDGVYDDIECENLSFNISGGNTHNSSLISVENYLILDIFSLDNSFNLQINGTDLAAEIQFQNIPGNFARFLDGFGYGENGNPDIWTVTGSEGSPMLRVVVDELGQFNLFGSRTSNGPLEPMVLTTPVNAFTWNPGGNNTISISQDTFGATNMQGVLLTAGCDTDSDGLPDQLDLDSDSDGCSDANEFYKDENEDGGDGGEYGTGIPAVDPTDGTVNAASYVGVIAPEILLENTSEDLGGMDINGQNLSLGSTFNYVLRFQNTGDDNATNYTVRDLLPNNVTVDNIDISNAPNTAPNHDVVNGVITFDVPDNLVEVGDPEYSIRITVTVAASCSSFVDACSSLLENRAYSTYQGVVNTNTFTDENGSNSITACPRTPEVASNSILDDLIGCSEPRTEQLCGASALLRAGQGFATYQWYLDTNGDGQADPGDTQLNADPDGDPSTYLITAIGTYIVEKSSNGSCPDLVEVINVERFGTTQTNPIVAYFNQVNSDVNPDNDIQGEIRVDCNDGTTQFTDIFLCGAADSALLQMNITDASGGLFWERLDESSCTVETDGCLTRNLGCTWNEVGTGNDYTADTSGKYRLSVTYAGGCFSRFYFNVFQNELNFTLSPPTDILCDTNGNIRITGVGAGYGFQLVNANDDSIVVPFSANNGPNFDIAVSGTYRVQMTALNPSDNTPIAGSCIFETEDIGIQEQLFDVSVSSTPADCNTLGTISIAALNARPNYSYELFFDDGSNGGLGSPAGNQIAVNDNTHTFSSLAPRDYKVVTSTQDGCSISRDITVAEIPQLDIIANTSENITCTPGVVNVTPSGGQPSPEYEMAIWSIDGVLQYTSDKTSVPDSAYQTETTFLFGDTGNPNRGGEYIFIVRDQNGCYDLSNPVRVDDLGTMTISASNSDIVCADSSTATMTVTVTGGTAPYRYSLDGGSNYQTNNNFGSLSAGLYTITVMDSSGTPGAGCVETFDYEIVQPFRLLASTTIIEDASCNPSGALVKIMNPSGGQAPYEYSFNGGAFSGTSTSNLLPGNHQFTIQDALGCTYDMELTVPNSPNDPSFANNVTYDCDGFGTITVTPSNTTDFTYSYDLNGTANAPADNNVFTGVSDGTHTINIAYETTLAANQSILFSEDFGAGPSTQIAEIGPDYCYEPQDGSTVSCNRGPAGILVNGEYTVTNFVTNPISSLTSPLDHTSLTDGRFLAIDVSTFSDTGVPKLNTVLWTKQNIEVLPNREITISFWAYNLMNVSGAGNNPEVLVEIFNSSGTLIHSEAKLEIPKNNNNLDWHPRTVTFDPGTNTDIDIVFRSNVNSNDGNDLILDDIQASQVPDVCSKTDNIIVVVEDNKEFSTNVLGSTNPSCPTGMDGSVRFEVLNFPATGYRYSTDGTNWTTSMVAEVTTTTPLAAGTYTMQIESLPISTSASCTTDFSFTLTDPAAIVPSLTQTAEYTCFNTGGTLLASATGGAPGYEYQLEETGGTVVVAYQTNDTFTNIPEGPYLVRVRDSNGCSVLSPLADVVTVLAPQNLALTTSVLPTCYDGLSSATITATATSGNGGYTFRIINGAIVGPWLTPEVATPSSYTFNGLTNGNYTIEVQDSFNCGPVQEIVTINPQLTGNASLKSDLTCAADAGVNLNITGGSGTYSYEWSNTNTGPWDATGFTANTFSTATAGTYYFRATDSATPTACIFITNSIAVSVAETPVITGITPTDLTCNANDTGSLAILIDTTVGLAPYTINVLNTTTGFEYGNQTTSLAAGDYTVTVTDSKDCFVTGNATIDEPLIITPNITNTNLTCTATGTELGTITVDASGGNPDYIYTVHNIDFSVNETYDTSSGTNDHTFTNLDFGDYIVTITDSNDCQTTSTVTITTGPDILITTQGASGCTPGSGEMLVEAQASNGTLGVGNFYFAIFPAPAFNAADPAWFPEDIAPAPDNTHLFTGLTPGVEYTFVVHDTSTNCEFVQEATVPVSTVSNLNAIIDPVTPITCTGFANGIVEFTISGYDATTVNYEIFTSTTNVTTGITGTLTGAVGGPETETVNNLSPGEFYILFTEMDGANAGCVNTSDSFVIEQPTTLLEVSANATKDANCNELGSITASGSFGVAPYQYQFLPDTDPAPTAASTSWITNTVANVAVGDYIVYIKDASNCIQLTPTTVTVAFNTAPAIDTVTIVDFCAANGSYEVEVTLTSPDNALYNLSINGEALQNANFVNGVFTVTGLSEAAIAQSISIEDINGCGNTENFEILPKFQTTALPNKPLDCSASPNGEITITASNGYGPFEFEVTGPIAPTGPIAIPSPANTIVWNGATMAGMYTVSIRDTHTGCPAIQFPIEIDPAVSPDFIANPTAVSCEGASDGVIAIVETNNGTNPLSYTLSPAVTTINPITNSFEGLPGGTYEVTGSGTNGCSTTFSNIVVGEPNDITFDPPTVTPFQCSDSNTQNNATITVNSSSFGGGSDTFTNIQFEEVTSGDIQNGTSSNYNFTDIAGGDVIVRVFDDKGCVGEQTVTVPVYDRLNSATVIVDDPISCTNLGERILIDISAFTLANYEFRMLPSGAFQSSNIFPDLQPDTYTFEVRNVNTGCGLIVDHVVEDPNTFDLVVQKLADVTCFLDDGQIQLAITDATYTGDYSWTIYNPQGTPTDRLDDTAVMTMPPSGDPRAPIDVPAGDYIVEVTQDAFPSCGQFRAFTITSPTADITISPIALEEVGCNNDRGSANITPIGGLAPYDITLTNTSTSTIYPTVNGVYSHLFQGLSGGQFSIAVTDALGCPRTFTNAFTLDPTDPISGTLTADSLDCEGENDATIRFVFTPAPRNVFTNYSYVLNKYIDASKTTSVQFTAPQTSPEFRNQGPGFYTILVEDDLGCTFENAIPIEIVNPTEVNGVLELTQSLGCTVDAALQITATGGTGPYTWSTDGINFNAMNEINGPNTHLFQNVTPGPYQYFIQDNLFCDARFPTNEIVINAIEDLTVQPVDAGVTPTINCNGEATAVINWVADGGLGNYEYGLFRDAAHTDEVRPYQATGTFADLPADTYYVHVQSEDCVVTSLPIVITEPVALEVIPNVTNISCYGDENGRIELDIQYGTAPYQFAISPNLTKFVDDNGFENLSTGDYRVIVQDANGCIELVEFTITEPDRLELSLTATPEICAGDEDGTIIIVPNGGTPPYSTAIGSDNDADFVDGRLLIENLSGGDYFVYLKDANGCVIEDLIRVESGANLTAEEELIIECTGDTPTTRVNVILEDPSVKSDVLFALDSTDPNDMVMEPDFENLAPGEHYIYMLHANGCSNTINFEVEGFEPLVLTLEQLDLNEITATATGGKEGYTFYFDDQNNGTENTFYIRRTDTYTVRVVDDNGCESIATIEMEFIDIEIPNFFTPDGDGYNDFWIPRNITQFPDIFIKIYDRYGREVYRIQDTEEGWDGFYQEAELPTGDYWYVIKLNGEEDDREFVGNFTLYR